MTFPIKFGSTEEAETYSHGTTLPDFPIISSSWYNKIKIKMTPTFVCLFYDVGTTPLCHGCGVGTKFRLHNFVVVPRFTTRALCLVYAGSTL